MLIKYKTYKYGEKSCYLEGPKNTPKYDSERIEKFKVEKYNFCCQLMEDYIKYECGFYFGGLTLPEAKLQTSIPDGYGDSDEGEVKFCQFCGKKVEYEESKVVRYKKKMVTIEKYIEEEIING